MELKIISGCDELRICVSVVILLMIGNARLLCLTIAMGLWATSASGQSREVEAVKADSARKAIVDSLTRAKLPRRIRGTITNGRTGRPIPFAQILMFGPRPSPNNRVDPIPRPDQRGVADRRGRYTISTPAVGLAMLVVLCPGKIYFDRPSPRIVLAVANIPEGQERPETPSKVIPMESDDYNMSDPIQVPIPPTFDAIDE